MGKYKPALFNSAMVNAILEDRKVETRRVVKPQPVANLLRLPDESCWPGCFASENEQRIYKPPYQPGDIIWVRETYRVDYLSNIPGAGRVQYKADSQYADIRFDPARYEIFRRAQRKPGWRSCECMPREAARLFLRVKDIRVDHLQEMDGLDAYNEGAVAPMPAGCNPPEKPDGFDRWSRDKQDEWIQSMARATYISRLDFSKRLINAFRSIWDQTMQKKDIPQYGWAADPYVWIIEFEKVEKPKSWPD